jgi:AcrR family transcriptional regulator
MPTKAEQAAQTREALEGVARELFETRGFATVSAEEIVAAAGVTRGALYHHYGGKEGLFEAVAEAAMQRLHDKLVRAAGSSTDPLEGLKQGARRFLELSSAPRTQLVLFVDAPVVMGWQRWRQMDARYGFGLILRALDRVVAQGRMRSTSREIVAHLLLGALIEASMLIANSSQKANARAEAETVVGHLIDGLCTGAP